MLQPILKNLSIVLILLIANKAIAQGSAKNKSAASDTTYSIQFNWEMENARRNNSHLSYASANICSRWIKFSDQAFLKLKDFDGENVKITLQHSVTEGMKSKEARGIDTHTMQGTSDDISCDYILKIELDN